MIKQILLQPLRSIKKMEELMEEDESSGRKGGRVTGRYGDGERGIAREGEGDVVGKKYGRERERERERWRQISMEQGREGETVELYLRTRGVSPTENTILYMHGKTTSAAIIMFKAYRYILPMNVQNLFKIHESRYSPRHKYKFKQIYVRTNFKIMCISVTGVKLWNSLDNSLICCINVHHFKKCYTNRLLNSYVLES